MRRLAAPRQMLAAISTLLFLARRETAAITSIIF
jgi:hypothetical protein